AQDAVVAAEAETPPDAAKIARAKASALRAKAGYDDCKNSNTNTNAGGCENAEADFTKAIADSHCPGVLSKPGDAHDIGCGQAVERCACLQAPRNERPICSEVPEHARSSSKGVNLGDVEQRFQVCPALAAKDIDKLEQEVKEA